MRAANLASLYISALRFERIVKAGPDTLDYKDTAALESDIFEEVAYEFGLNDVRIPDGYSAPRAFNAWDTSSYFSALAAVFQKKGRQWRKSLKLELLGQQKVAKSEYQRELDALVTEL